MYDEGRARRLLPEDCEKAFDKSVQYIGKVAEQYPDKTLVVITHYAPSIQSVDEKYVNSALTAAFACNLEKFILRHPNIKLWCHGHVHTFKDYKIGQCRVVCNPLGYAQYGEKSGFRPDFTVDLLTGETQKRLKHEMLITEDYQGRQKE